MVLQPDRACGGPSAAPPPVDPSITALLCTVTPFQTTVIRAFSVLTPEPLNRAARKVMSYVCHVSGAVAAFDVGANL